MKSFILGKLQLLLAEGISSLCAMVEHRVDGWSSIHCPRSFQLGLLIASLLYLTTVTALNE
jgi:hypothetical protein